MPVEITELTFLEQLAERHRIPVPRFVSGDAPARDLREGLEAWGGKAIIKPDVLAGKRGKCGAVKKVDEFVEAQRVIKKVGNMEIGSKLPRGAYAVEVVPAEAEAYSAITYDSRSFSPMLTLSMKGGMDIEAVDEKDKVHLPVDVFKGLDAYQASEMLEKLGCPKNALSKFARALVNVWDLFISTGMRMCEINPWRINSKGDAVACDFKAVFDEANYKFKNLGLELPDYPASTSSLEEEMTAWSASSHQGQAHVSGLGGSAILPILFGGGASTIVCETLESSGGSPIFLSDFGGNPPYERMYGTAKICFDHHLADARLLLILGGKANNTLIDVTFQAIGDALANYFEEKGPVDIPVIVGRGGPHLVKGLTSLRNTLETLGVPYVIFGPDTPVTLVAEYAARIARSVSESGGEK